MFLRRRAKDATVQDGDVILDGHDAERLPGNSVYVSPSTGKSYDGGKGDTLAMLPPDAVSLPKTTWGGYCDEAPFFYSGDKWYNNSPEGTRRLNLEKLQMPQNSLFQLQKDSNGRLSWTGCLRSHHHVHRITMLYSDDHPYDEIIVYITNPKLPQVNHHIFSDGKICYQLNNWTTSWTAYTVLCTVIRFLDDFYAGRMKEDYLLRRFAF